MRTSTVAIAAVVTGVAAAVTWPDVSEPVTATYDCNAVTFVNQTEERVRVSHGVPRTGAVSDVFVPAGASATVETDASDFRWWASSPDGTEALVSPGSGVDLSDHCADGADAAASPTPSGRGGLARTGDETGG